jgi:protein HOOK3
MDPTEIDAVLKWVNTFNLATPCASLSDLSDGIVIATALAEVDSGHFNANKLNKNVGDDWSLAASNLRVVVSMLSDFYPKVLRKAIDMSQVDCDAIARDLSEDDFMDLLELVVGCAVLCENKARFIKNIFSLDVSAQAVLKGMIERVMARVSDVSHADYEEEEEDDDAEVDAKNASFASNGEASRDNIMLQDMVRKMQAERLQLLSQIDHLEGEKRALVESTRALKEDLQRNDAEREAIEGNDRSRATAAVNANRALQADLEESRREADRLALELRSVKSELSAVSLRLNASEENRARLEVEVQQMADDLDVAKDRASKLSKAEATIDKYQRKLEEMVELRRQNKELEEKLDKYYDQIQDLEVSVKQSSSLNKLVEQYKDKSIEYEREKFEAVSALQMKEEELRRVTAELESMAEARRFLEEELSSARSELESDDHVAGASGGPGLGLFESAAALKETNMRLERELKIARQASADVGASGVNASEFAKLRDDVALLTAELDDTKRLKKEREDLLMQSRRQYAELQSEYQKVVKALQETEGVGGGGASSGALKEAEAQLAQRANTIRLLEEKLKEKETLINKLEQDKARLENFAKKTVAGFKEKYMNVLHRITAEKKTLESR